MKLAVETPGAEVVGIITVVPWAHLLSSAFCDWKRAMVQEPEVAGRVCMYLCTALWQVQSLLLLRHMSKYPA